MNRLRTTALIGIVFLFSGIRLFGHPFSLSYCRVHIADHFVTANLVIQVEDLVWFGGLKPDSSGQYETATIYSEAEEYCNIIEGSLSLYVDQKLKYPLDVELQMPEWMKDKGLVEEALNKQLDYTIRFPKTVDSKELIISQLFGIDDPLVPSLMIIRTDGRGVVQSTIDLHKGECTVIDVQKSIGGAELVDPVILVEQSPSSLLLKMTFPSESLEWMKSVSTDDACWVESFIDFDVEESQASVARQTLEVQWYCDELEVKIPITPNSKIAISWLKFSRKLQRVHCVLPDGSKAKLTRFQPDATIF